MWKAEGGRLLDPFPLAPADHDGDGNYTAVIAQGGGEVCDHVQVGISVGESRINQLKKKKIKNKHPAPPHRLAVPMEGREEARPHEGWEGGWAVTSSSRVSPPVFVA